MPRCFWRERVEIMSTCPGGDAPCTHGKSYIWPTLLWSSKKITLLTCATFQPARSIPACSQATDLFFQFSPRWPPASTVALSQRNDKLLYIVVMSVETCSILGKSKGLQLSLDFWHLLKITRACRIRYSFCQHTWREEMTAFWETHLFTFLQGVKWKDRWSLFMDYFLAVHGLPSLRLVAWQPQSGPLPARKPQNVTYTRRCLYRLNKRDIIS